MSSSNPIARELVPRELAANPRSSDHCCGGRPDHRIPGVPGPAGKQPLLPALREAGRIGATRERRPQPRLEQQLRRRPTERETRTVVSLRGSRE